MDLVRWKIAGKALTRPNYGMLYPVSLLREKIIDKGLWFWPDVPQIDEDLSLIHICNLYGRGYLL